LGNKKKIIIVLILMAITLLGISLYYWYNNTYYIKTEDAKVDGPVIKVSPLVTGKIIDISVDENEKVMAGQPLARQDDKLLSSAVNSELSIIRAPIDGVIIKKVASIGEILAPGQSVFMMMDPYSLYITANIEETISSSLSLGQEADVWLDSIPGQYFHGRVDRIGEASLSTFSLLPGSSSSSSFTKVVQRIPVKIVLDDFYGYQLIHGTNAKVRIHIK
jgi:multidrug resistance efflux pump